MLLKKNAAKKLLGRRFLAALLSLLVALAPFLGMPVQAAVPSADAPATCTLTLYDIDPDGKDSGAAQTVTAEPGRTLETIFTAQATRIGADGADARKCKWFTVGEDGARQAFALTDTVTGDLTLYTYSYRIRVYLDLDGDGVGPDEGQEAALTLSVRASAKLKTSDFIVNGQDLGELDWYDLDEEKTVNPAEFCANGVYRSYRILATEPADGVPQATVRCCAAVDGAWETINQIVTRQRTDWGNHKRYYLTSEQVAHSYKDLGVTPAQIGADRRFPHTDSEYYDTLWADTLPELDEDSGQYWVPLSHRTSIYLYYLPNNVETNAAYFDSSVPRDDAAVLAENMFYSLQVLDPANLTQGAALPERQYIFHGTACSVTVPRVADVTWSAINAQTGEPVAMQQESSADGKSIIFSLAQIEEPVELVATGAERLVTYQADLTDQLVKLGEFTISRQEIIQNGTVQGETTYYDPAAGDQYTVLAPDLDVAVVQITGSNANARKLAYSFQGWQVGETETVLQPGRTLSDAQLAKYANSAGRVTFKAIWQAKDSHDRIATVNFFLNLDSEICDNMANGFVPQHQSKFTSAVYMTRIFGTDAVSGSGDTQLLAPPTEADTAYTVDTQLRSAVTASIEPGITMEAFPTDEEIFATLRKNNQTIKLDGQTVPSEQLTSDRFTIRWYVLKYAHSDGWHIDGVLVAKQGRLIVRKTFAGAQEAIDEVKQKFTVAVTHENADGQSVGDYTLCLASADAAADGQTGYTSYDPETQTYTWCLTARQGRTYTIQEQAYTLSTQKWNHTHRYQVLNESTNDRENGAARASWQTYDAAGVQVAAVAYPSDVPDTACQTVAFQNIYVEAGMLTVSKIDSVTGNGLAQVSFRLSSYDGSDLTVYRRPGTSEYSTDVNAPASGYTERVKDNLLTTDANGSFYIYLAIAGVGQTSASYYLEESAPQGYEGASKILVRVSDDGVIEMASEVIESTANGGDWISGENTATLTIKNRSKLLTEVEAVKNWDATPEEDRLPVKVELWRNGSKVPGSAYTQELNAENGWTHTWKNLPLFVDGVLAVYSLREIQIGDTAYDPGAGPDGYADYLVSYAQTLYREGDAGVYSQEATWLDETGTVHFADHALLRLYNTQRKGAITLTKLDETGAPLPGARFTLYADQACKTALETVQSDTGGFVIFTEQPAGTYYFKETTAPAGFAPNKTVYAVTIRNGAATITPLTGNGPPLTQIINQSAMTLQLCKRSTTGATLPDAEFTLERDGALYGTYQTDAAGLLTIPALPAGVYQLRETKSPAGYRLREDGITLRVASGGIDYVYTDGTEDLEAWQLQQAQDGTYLLTVTNEALYELPETGGPGTGVIALLGAALLACGGLLCLRRRRARASAK